MKFGGWILGGLGMLWALSSYFLANTPFLHTQKYAVVACIFLAMLVRLVVLQFRGGIVDEIPREETIAHAGVSLALSAAILCCLLAPESRLLAGSPAKNVDVAGTDFQVVFPTSAVPLGASSRLTANMTGLGGRRVLLQGTWPLLLANRMFLLRPHVVATVSARGFGGTALTITQPLGNAFLSQMLVFPNATEVAGLRLPSDIFALPARGRNVRAFLVTSAEMRDPRIARMSGERSGVLFSVDDANGRALDHGIGFVPDRLSQTIGDIVLSPKLGLFPDLQVASVPEPIPMIIGLTAYIIGGATLLYRRKTKLT